MMENQFEFSTALMYLKIGKRAARSGWNGKGMWLILVKQAVPWGGGEWEGKKVIYDAVVDNENFLPWIGMKTADNKFVPWLASQTDLLAEDWTLVE